MLRGRMVLRWLGIAALSATALAACGSNRPTVIPPKKPPTLDAHKVYIYSSLPEHGPLQGISRQITDGIDLAIDEVGRHVGGYTIEYEALNDATGSGWSPKLTVKHAQAAARNPSTVAYIGDLESSATELSLPILNQARIVQITPGSGYPGLTDSIPGVTGDTEPSRFYPLYPQERYKTLLRLTPSDDVEARAILKLLEDKQCRNLAVASFYGKGDIDGVALSKAIAKFATKYGIAMPPLPPLGSDVKKYAEYAASLSRAGIGCYVLIGRVTPAAVTLTKYILDDLPRAPIVGTSGFCNRRWTRQSPHGVPTYADSYLYCASPVLPVTKYSSVGKRFIDEYRRWYHRYPGPYAIYGYHAAELVIDAMPGLNSGYDNRHQILQSVIGGQRYPDALGGYTLDMSGDLPPTSAYQLYQVANGVPKYLKSITP